MRKRSSWAIHLLAVLWCTHPAFGFQEQEKAQVIGAEKPQELEEEGPTIDLSLEDMQPFLKGMLQLRVKDGKLALDRPGLTMAFENKPQQPYAGKVVPPKEKSPQAPKDPNTEKKPENKEKPKEEEKKEETPKEKKKRLIKAKVAQAVQRPDHTVWAFPLIADSTIKKLFYRAGKAAGAKNINTMETSRIDGKKHKVQKPYIDMKTGKKSMREIEGYGGPDHRHVCFTKNKFRGLLFEDTDQIKLTFVELAHKLRRVELEDHAAGAFRLALTAPFAHASLFINQRITGTIEIILTQDGKTYLGAAESFTGFVQKNEALYKEKIAPFLKSFGVTPPKTEAYGTLVAGTVPETYKPLTRYAKDLNRFIFFDLADKNLELSTVHMAQNPITEVTDHFDLYRRKPQHPFKRVPGNPRLRPTLHQHFYAFSRQHARLTPRWEAYFPYTVSREWGYQLRPYSFEKDGLTGRMDVRIDFMKARNVKGKGLAATAKDMPALEYADLIFKDHDLLGDTIHLYTNNFTTHHRRFVFVSAKDLSLYFFEQFADGQSTVAVFNGKAGKPQGWSAPSFAKLYAAHTMFMEDTFFTGLSSWGAGHFDLEQPGIRLATLSKIWKHSEEEAETCQAILEELDSEDLQERATAEKELRQHFVKYRTALEEAAKDPGLSVEVNAKIKEILLAGNKKLEAGLIYLKSLNLDENPTYLTGYLKSEDPQTRAMAQKQLEKLTGQTLGTDPTAWRDWINKPKDK